MFGLSFILSIITTFIGFLLVILINFISNVCFFGKASIHHTSVADNKLGPWVILIPIVGGAIVGFDNSRNFLTFFRLLSKIAPAIRGHGIPEAMESILHKESKIPPK